ncbi:hypothetical protein BHS06_00535 [Myxococcus xanthus]|nr:hypothetical protein BHS06_00535 [Myxococcus xanthus]
MSHARHPETRGGHISPVRVEAPAPRAHLRDTPRVAMPNVPSHRRLITACTLLLGCLLSASSHAVATDAPLRDTPPSETRSRYLDTPAAPSPERAAVPTYIEPEDVLLPKGAWVAHGGLALLPVAGVWGASRVGGDTRVGATAAETATGMLLGAIPSRLLFFRPAAPSPGRWMELETVAFGGGFVLTPPLTALGTWGLGELAFGESHHPGRAYLGALGGAALGTLLGVIVHEALVKLSKPSARLKSGRQLVGLGFIGVGATLGYQWAGGGPRPDGHTR